VYPGELYLCPFCETRVKRLDSSHGVRPGLYCEHGCSVSARSQLADKALPHMTAWDESPDALPLLDRPAVRRLGNDQMTLIVKAVVAGETYLCKYCGTRVKALDAVPGVEPGFYCEHGCIRIRKILPRRSAQTD
jgi:hypothetical protein